MTLVEQVRATVRPPSAALAREIRRDAGVSQQALADELGVHRLTVVRWETGASRPRGEMRAIYAALLSDLQSVVRS